MVSDKHVFSIKTGGLSLGLLFAIIHIFGSLIGVSAGGTTIELWHRLHFLRYEYTILPLQAGDFIIGTILAFVTGLIIGILFVLIWNWFERRK